MANLISRAVRAPATVSQLESRVAFWLVFPAATLMVLLLFGPVLSVFLIALTNWQFGASSFEYIGASNFVALAQDRTFWIAFRNTAQYVILVVIGCVAGGLFVALLIEASPRFRRFYRAAHFLPVMATIVAMAISWEILLHPSIGLINYLLSFVGIAPRNWLRDEATALWALCAIGIWQNLGFAMVLFMAGLKAIPGDLYEAADIDGADRWFDRLATVTFPLLGPITMFVLVVVSIRALQVFETVQVLTKGGPNKSTEVLLYHLYVESFSFLRTGYGAAVTVIYLCVVVGLTLTQAQLLERRVHYS